MKELQTISASRSSWATLYHSPHSNNCVHLSRPWSIFFYVPWPLCQSTAAPAPWPNDSVMFNLLAFSESGITGEQFRSAVLQRRADFVFAGCRFQFERSHVSDCQMVRFRLSQQQPIGTLLCAPKQLAGCEVELENLRPNSILTVLPKDKDHIKPMDKPLVQK